MTIGREITIGLAWREDDKVVAAVIPDDGIAFGASAGSVVGRGLLRSGEQYVLRLGRVLLPRDIRRSIAAELKKLEQGERLRLRLRLPSSAGRPVSLGALPWERVRVPAEDVHDRSELWREWADSKDNPPGEYRELRLDQRFSVVREPAGQETPAPAAGDGSAVVIADATAVHGDVDTARGVESLPEPSARSVGDRDGSRVEVALRRSRFEVRQVTAPATKDTIRAALTGAAVFYFGGHHIAEGLIVAQRPGQPHGEVLDPGTLSGWLTGLGVRIAVLMACDTASSPAGAGNVYSTLAEYLAAQGVPYVVAVHGAVSDGASARFAGRFFAALDSGQEIDVAVAEASVSMAEIQAMPALHTARRMTHLRLSEHPLAGRTGVTSLAHRMAVPPFGQAVHGVPDERHQVRLETLWCLTEGPFVDVLADVSGDDLTTLLSRTEQLLYQADAAERPAVERPEWRRWYAIDADRVRDPGTRGELLGLLQPSYSRPDPGRPRREDGLVVRWPAGDQPPADWSTYLGRLRGLLGERPAVVVQVHGHDDRAVRDEAVRVARDLGCEEYLVRCSVSPDSRRGPSAVRGARLTGAEQVRRRLGEVAQGTAAAVPDELDAEAIVSELNESGDWGGWRAECAVLGSVAEHWPHVFPALLRAHAAGRTGTGRYASLSLAATSDTQMRRWLRDACRRLPFPSEFTGVRIPEEVADSVTLALLHQEGRTAAVEEWGSEAVSRAVLDVLRVAERGTPVEKRDMDKAATAIALDRAGLLGDTDVCALDPKGECKGSWALLTRRRLAEDEARWLAQLGEPQRRLVGMARAAAVYDLELEEKLAGLREARRPPLPPG